MARNRRLILSSPSEVRGLLSDGHRYREWVTGTQQILAADAQWPDVGARLRVRVGVGSLTLDDTCVVRICEPRRRLELEAKAGPFGAARIVMNLIPWGEHTLFVLDWHPLRCGVAPVHPQASGDATVRSAGAGLRVDRTGRGELIDVGLASALLQPAQTPATQRAAYRRAEIIGAATALRLRKDLPDSAWSRFDPGRRRRRCCRRTGGCGD